MELVFVGGIFDFLAFFVPSDMILSWILQTEMDCGFLMWIDPEPTPFMKTLLLDLRDAIWRLKKENSELEIALRDGLEVLPSNQALEMEIIEKTEELKAKDRKLEELNATLQDMAAKLSSRSICSSFSTVVCVFSVALVVGMLVGVVFFR